MKAIIFDMDGVLINSMKYHVVSWKKAFENHGINVSEEELFLYEGMSFRETINRIANAENIRLFEEDQDKIYFDKKNILESIFKLEIYPEIKEFLFVLKEKGMLLAVVTGAHKEWATHLIHDNFKDMFNVLVTAEDVEKGKPAPDEYLKALEMLNLEAKDAIVIENAPLGIKSAKSAGLRVYALETTLDKKYLQDADKLFENHENLFNHLKEIL